MRRALGVVLVLCLAMTFTSIEPMLPLGADYATAVAQEKQKKRGFFQRLFGGFRSPKPKKELKPVEIKKPEITKPVITALPKIEDANRIVVLGDRTADAIFKGLVKTYERTPSVEISARIDRKLTMVNSVFYSWLDASDFTFLGENVKAVVISLGTLDRAAIEESTTTAPFNSETWRRNYSRRLVDVAAQLQLMGVPVIWVLPPPVIDDWNTEQALRIANLQRQVYSAFDFTLVDVTDGFTNDKGEYRQLGTSLNGTQVVLRLNDGIGFTPAGRRKLAHYVRQEIDRILDENLSTDILLQSGINRAKSQKVVILTRPQLTSDAKLVGGNGRASAFYSDPIARAFFVKGNALNAPSGRADNFEWPQQTATKDTAQLKN